MKLGAVHRSRGISLAEEKLGNSQLGDRLMKAVRSVIASNGVSYVKMMFVEPPSMPDRRKEGKIWDKSSCCIVLYFRITLYFY